MLTVSLDVQHWWCLVFISVSSLTFRYHCIFSHLTEVIVIVLLGRCPKQSCQPLRIRRNSSHPWWNHYARRRKNNRVIFMPVCVYLEGGRESISNQHFLVVVPQPICFCIWKKWASRSAWFSFLCLIITPLRDTSWQNAVSILHFFHLCWSRRLVRMGLLERNIRHFVKSSLVVHHYTVMKYVLHLILYHSCWHGLHDGCGSCSLIGYQNVHCA